MALKTRPRFKKYNKPTLMERAKNRVKALECRLTLKGTNRVTSREIQSFLYVLGDAAGVKGQSPANLEWIGVTFDFWEMERVRRLHEEETIAATSP